MKEYTPEESEREGIFSGGVYWTLAEGETNEIWVLSKGYVVTEKGEQDLANNVVKYTKTELLVKDGNGKARLLKVSKSLGRDLNNALKVNKTALQGSMWRIGRTGKTRFNLEFIRRVDVQAVVHTMALNEVRRNAPAGAPQSGFWDSLPEDEKVRVIKMYEEANP